MKVIIDPLIFDLQLAGGISRYVSELVKGLKKKTILYFPLVMSKNIYVKKFPFFAKRITTKSFHLKRTISLLYKHPDAIYHPSYYDSFFLQNDFKNKLVITVHDFIVETYPELFDEYEIKLNEIKRKLIERADRIIAISEATKADIVKLCNISVDKIDVVYHGSRFNTLLSKPVLNLPKKYILYVGSRFAYKNYSEIIKHFSQLPNQQFNLHLICAGNTKFNQNELDQLKELNLTERVHHVSCSDSELKYLYENAYCLIFPSKKEGFGIPIIEAFQSNCPVILSDIPVFREIADKAAIYINPENSVDFIQAVSKLADVTIRAELIKLGFERAKLFSWENTINQTVSVYSKTASI